MRLLIFSLLILSGCLSSDGITGTCSGDLTCAIGAPICASDEAAEILDGCYTGECLVRDRCDDQPLARCDELVESMSCDARPDCWSRWIGTRCTCDGMPCNCREIPDACTCATWNFSCVSN